MLRGQRTKISSCALEEEPYFQSLPYVPPIYPQNVDISIRVSQGQSQEFLFGGAKCDANIFIKTTSTHIYIYTYARFFIIYAHFLFDKLYIYTQPKKKKKSLVFSIKIIFDGDLS